MLVRLYLRTLVVLALFACAAACAAQPPYAYLDARTGPLLSPDGRGCSAWTAGKYEIGTTKHCYAPGQAQVRYQGRLVNIVSVRYEGAENIYLTVDVELGPVARIARRKPKPGERLWIVGNPIGLPQMIRQARLAGYFEGVQMIDCLCAPGDSGSAVFNDQGEVVGIYYGAIGSRGAPGFFFPLAYPVKR